MKKNLIVLLSLVLLGFTACGNSEKDVVENVNVDTEIEDTEEDASGQSEEEYEELDGVVFELYPEGGDYYTFVLGIGDDSGVTPIVNIKLPGNYILGGATYDEDAVPAEDDRTYLSESYVFETESKVHNDIVLTAPMVLPQILIGVYEGSISDLSDVAVLDTVDEYEIGYEYYSESNAISDKSCFLMIQINEEYLLYASYASDELEEDEIYDFAEMFVDTITVIE